MEGEVLSKTTKLGLLVSIILLMGVSALVQEKPTEERKLSIVIDISAARLTVYEDGEVVRRFPVAVGKPETPSPVGEWKIISKSRDWGGGFGTRWLGLNVPWGIYGIHGTNKPHSIGARASAGCFRMHNRNVEALFEMVSVGTPVTVIGPTPPLKFERILRPGAVGQDIVYLQWALRRAGFDAGTADGRFGPLAVRAISRLRSFYGLPANDGIAGEDVYRLLTEVHRY